MNKIIMTILYCYSMCFSLSSFAQLKIIRPDLSNKTKLQTTNRKLTLSTNKPGKVGLAPVLLLNEGKVISAYSSTYLVVANWLGDGNIGTGPHAVEFDANNKLVWSWEDHSAAQTITNLLVVE